MPDTSNNIVVVFPSKSNAEQITQIYTAINRCCIVIEMSLNHNGNTIKEKGLKIIKMEKGSFLLVLGTKVAIECIPIFVKLIKDIVDISNGNKDHSNKKINASIREAVIKFLITLIVNAISIKIGDIDLTTELAKKMLFYLYSLWSPKYSNEDKKRIEDLMNKL